ncbi:MAG: ATP-dependent Clp protease adapter ClpS [Arachnia sp.]
MTTQPAGDTQVTERPAAAPVEQRQWVTIVWDDPVNLMSYVTYVFQEYFSYPRDRAEELMLQVHHHGRAVVSSGNREEMERDVLAMQGYNLWATMEQS